MSGKKWQDLDWEGRTFLASGLDAQGTRALADSEKSGPGGFVPIVLGQTLGLASGCPGKWLGDGTSPPPAQGVQLTGNGGARQEAQALATRRWSCPQSPSHLGPTPPSWLLLGPPTTQPRPRPLAAAHTLASLRGGHSHGPGWNYSLSQWDRPDRGARPSLSLGTAPHLTGSPDASATSPSNRPLRPRFCSQHLIPSDLGGSGAG